MRFTVAIQLTIWSGHQFRVPSIAVNRVRTRYDTQLMNGFAAQHSYEFSQRRPLPFFRAEWIVGYPHTLVVNGGKPPRSRAHLKLRIPRQSLPVSLSGLWRCASHVAQMTCNPSPGKLRCKP